MLRCPKIKCFWEQRTLCVRLGGSFVREAQPFSSRTTMKCYSQIGMNRNIWVSSTTVPGGRNCSLHKPNILATTAMTSAPMPFKSLSIKLIFMVQMAHRWHSVSPGRTCPREFGRCCFTLSLSLSPSRSLPFFCCSWSNPNCPYATGNDTTMVSLQMYFLHFIDYVL